MSQYEEFNYDKTTCISCGQKFKENEKYVEVPNGKTYGTIHLLCFNFNCFCDAYKGVIFFEKDNKDSIEGMNAHDLCAKIIANPHYAGEFLFYYRHPLLDEGEVRALCVDEVRTSLGI